MKIRCVFPSVVLCVGVCVGMGCAEQVDRPARSPRSTRLALPSASRNSDGQQRSFQFQALDGGIVTSSSLHGRMTLIVFAATFDMHSQAQARFVNALVHHHVPRINALLLVLEPPSHRPLVQAFVGALDLTYGAALADSATMEGHGPFEGLHHVPSVVLLDRSGREVWRHLGVVDEKTLSQVIVEHDERSGDH